MWTTFNSSFCLKVFFSPEDPKKRYEGSVGGTGLNESQKIFRTVNHQLLYEKLNSLITQGEPFELIIQQPNGEEIRVSSEEISFEFQRLSSGRISICFNVDGNSRSVTIDDPKLVSVVTYSKAEVTAGMESEKTMTPSVVYPEGTLGHWLQSQITSEQFAKLIENREVVITTYQYPTDQYPGGYIQALQKHIQQSRQNKKAVFLIIVDNEELSNLNNFNIQDILFLNKKNTFSFPFILNLNLIPKISFEIERGRFIIIVDASNQGLLVPIVDFRNQTLIVVELPAQEEDPALPQSSRGQPRQPSSTQLTKPTGEQGPSGESKPLRQILSKIFPDVSELQIKKLDLENSPELPQNINKPDLPNFAELQQNTNKHSGSENRPVVLVILKKTVAINTPNILDLVLPENSTMGTLWNVVDVSKINNVEIISIDQKRFAIKITWWSFRDQRNYRMVYILKNYNFFIVQSPEKIKGDNQKLLEKLLGIQR